MFFHPAELVEQLGPTVVAFEKLEAGAAAVAELEERAVTCFVPKNEPRGAVVPFDKDGVSRISIGGRRAFKLTAIAAEDIIVHCANVEVRCNCCDRSAFNCYKKAQ